MRRSKWFCAARWLAALAVLSLVVACVGPCVTPTPAPPSSNKLGVHLLLDDGRNAWPMGVWPVHLEHARQAVGEWGYVTQLVRLDDLDPARWQVFVDLCAELHLTPILRLATMYDREAGWWTAPPRDDDGTYRTVAARYAEFVAALRWPTSEHTVVVGNEPNHGNEWGGKPDPEAYARFLIDVADALHTADANVRVLNAGLDPYAPHTGSRPFADGMYYVDEETFLDQMHAAYPGVFDRLDAWASHAYPMGPMTEGPWVQTYQVDLINDAANPGHVAPPQGVYNRGVNGYEWELFKLSIYGVEPLPVMITETGWRHAESVDPEAADGGAFPDAETVATYLDLALRGNGGRYPGLAEKGWQPWLDDPRVVAVIIFALDGLPAEWGHTNLLVLDAGGEVLGAYAPFDLLATEDAQP
ncbi:MAG: hypothetical protein JXA14_20395 [Anaerolineae bacterium]|nr:hypothetical protein [Anaerolineae bacterium]